MEKEKVAVLINLLFVELKGIFPAFKQSWPTDSEYESAKKNWVKAFMAAGINTVDLIRRGLVKCRLSSRDFVITPGQFIKWCKPNPEEIGYPRTLYAYEQAIRLNRGDDAIDTSEKAKQLILHTL